MITVNESICPICGGNLKYYDTIKRIVRTQGRTTTWIDVRRLQCRICFVLHRELPSYIFPYKQYEASIILSVIARLITSQTLGYEDYPCEMTMTRWKSK